MEPKDMLIADPLDILFENRNKSYGAYTLRSEPRDIKNAGLETGYAKSSCGCRLF